MRALAVVLVVGLPLVSRANPGAPQVALDQGRIAYERGDYGTAVETIQPLLYPKIELASEESVVEAHKLLALSYLFMRKNPEAEREATSLLELRPSYKLDRIVDPPVAVSFFEEVKRKQEDKLREIRERQRIEEGQLRRLAEARRLADRMVVGERLVIKNSRLIAALPFGIGQFQNRERKKAIFFAVSEALTGALSLAAWIAINQKFPSGQYPAADHDLAIELTAVQLISGGAFWGLVVWGLVDAQVKFKPEIIIETHEVPILPAAPKAPKVSLSLAPILSPGLYGLGLQGAF